MSTPLRVLFVEDSEDDMRLLVRQLRQGGYAPTFEQAETADGLRAALHRGGWDVIISDYSMPRFSGLEALAVTLQLAPDVPFLLVSGTVGEEVAVESIKAGAADYLMKQNLIRFVPAVNRALRDAAERRAMRRAESVLREQRSLLGMIFDNTSDALVLHTWDAAGGGLSTVERQPGHAPHVPGPGQGGGRGRPARPPAGGGGGGPVAGRRRRGRGCWTTSTRRPRPAGRGRGRPGSSPAATPVTAELTLIPFFGPDGQSRHLLAVVRDITARRRAEAARREFEARLAQSRKMEALGQLAGGVAHDFNNILAGILGFADMIRRTAPDPAGPGSARRSSRRPSGPATWSSRSSCSAAGSRASGGRSACRTW